MSKNSFNEFEIAHLKYLIRLEGNVMCAPPHRAHAERGAGSRTASI